MGRGGNSQALGARGLLYGPRRLGPGPTLGLIDSETPLAEMNWDKYVYHVSDICAAAGLIERISLPLRLNSKFSQPNQRASRHLFAVPLDKGHLRIVPTREGERHTVGFYFHDNKETSNLEDKLRDRLNGGSWQPTNFDQLEERLTAPLRAGGIEAIDTILDGQDILARLDQGQEIDFCSADWNQPSDIINRRLLARRAAGRAHRDGFLDEAEMATLDQLIDSGSQETNFIALLAANQSGAAAIASQEHINSQIKL